MSRGAYRGKAKKQTSGKAPMVTIITDYSDRRRDFSLPRDKARQLFNENKLRWDGKEKAYYLVGSKRTRERTRDENKR